MGIGLETRANGKTRLILLEVRDLELNILGGGTLPTPKSEGAEVLWPIKERPAVAFYKIEGNKQVELRPPFRRMPAEATGVFFPGLYLNNADCRLHYGEPKYTPITQHVQMGCF